MIYKYVCGNDLLIYNLGCHKEHVNHNMSVREHLNIYKPTFFLRQFALSTAYLHCHFLYFAHFAGSIMTTLFLTTKTKCLFTKVLKIYTKFISVWFLFEVHKSKYQQLRNLFVFYITKDNVQVIWLTLTFDLKVLFVFMNPVSMLLVLVS